MSHNISVVVNYKKTELFVTPETPDAGYLQFTRSGDWVYITRDGHDVGMMPATEFDRVRKMFA